MLVQLPTQSSPIHPNLINPQVTPLGWNYYELDLPSVAWAWELGILWPEGMDLGYYVAFDRQPTESDFDLGNATNSSFEVIICDSACAASYSNQVMMSLKYIQQSEQ